VRAHVYVRTFTQIRRKVEKDLFTAKVMLAALKNTAHVNTINVSSFEIIYLECLVINELESIWRDEVVALFKVDYYSSSCLEGMR
jgi:hypothetical protein